MVRLIVKSPYIPCSGGNAGGYMKYIATRENVEKYAQYIAERPGSHGLFGDDDTIDLQKATDELKDYTGNVWTHIISLRREDAVQYGYGYLLKDAKQLVDQIVDNMLQVKIVSDCYDRWLVLQGKVENFYADGNETKPRLPLSQVKEFRAIKNAVIKVADDIRLGRVTFEDEMLRQDDEPGEALEASQAYWQLRYVIEDKEHSLEERDEAVVKMKVLAAQDDLHAQYYLGKLYRDGGIVIPDSTLAEKYLRLAAERGMVEAQYAMGKLYLSNDDKVHDAAQGIRWLESAAELGSSDAAYLLGKLYLPKGREKAVRYFEQAAQQDNPHAQYVLGKIFLAEHDTERGMAYMESAAENGSECAWLFLNRRDSLTEPQLMLAATKLLYHIGRVFRDNFLPQTGTVQHIDRKCRQKLQAKRIAHGHKPDDHEEYHGPSLSM